MSKNNNSNFQDISSFSSKSGYKKAVQKKHTGRSVLRVFLSVLCVLLVLTGAVLVYGSNYMLSGLRTTNITKDKEDLGISEGTVTHDKITNIALFGVDTRSNTFTGLSDVIIVLSIDEVHNKIKLTSILRDSGVQIENHGYDKITHAYSLGGAELAINTLNSNFDLDITDYVTVNFYYMVEIIDAFGGVDVEIEDWEVDLINTHSLDIGLETEPLSPGGGVRHLNGTQAVAYSRIRNSDNDSVRASRQQNVLTALLSKATDISVLEYPDLIRDISELCETSLDAGDILGLTPILTSDFTVETLIVPGEAEENENGYIPNGEGGVYGYWMWMFDVEKAAENVREFIYEDTVEDTDDDETE